MPDELQSGILREPVGEIAPVATVHCSVEPRHVIGEVETRRFRKVTSQTQKVSTHQGILSDLSSRRLIAVPMRWGEAGKAARMVSSVQAPVFATVAYLEELASTPDHAGMSLRHDLDIRWFPQRSGSPRRACSGQQLLGGILVCRTGVSHKRCNWSS